MQPPDVLGSVGEFGFWALDTIRHGNGGEDLLMDVSGRALWEIGATYKYFVFPLC
jgi:hypothetical protein